MVGPDLTITGGLNVTELNAGDSSRASHVWRVDGPSGREVLRRSWWTTPEVSAFMLGQNRLFGVDPRDLWATADAYRFWQELGVWAVPQPLGFTQFQGAEALRMEWIEGEAPGSWDAADLAALGHAIARIHAHRRPHYGDVQEREQRPLSSFYTQALGVVREVTAHFAAPLWEGHWAGVEAAFLAAPAPSAAVPMLLDWNESQFVWRGGQPYALVDVESGPLAPAELDLCLWEVLLPPARAAEFVRGYTSLRPLPDLTPHRTPCRLLLLALEVEGQKPLTEWLARPHSFGP